MTETFHLHQAAIGRRGKASRNLRLIVNDFAAQKLRGGDQAAAGHLLGVAHQLVEVNFGRRYKSSGASTPLHCALTLQRSQGMPGRHQAYLVNPGQFSFGIDRVTGF